MNFQTVIRSSDGLEVIEIKNRLNGEYVNIIPGHRHAINEVVFNNEGTLHSVHKCAKSILEFQEIQANECRYFFGSFPEQN